MDAVQAFSKTEFKRDVTGFVVMGASKRGWTTWLTGAADPARVKGIVPMVYDNLNLPAQMRQQMRYFGKFSEQISPYTERNIQAALATDQGMSLANIVDPWAYRDRITMPKMIVNGANDPYWTVDSLNIYWNDLKGANYVMYVPNGGHSLGIEKDMSNVLRLTSGISAFVRSVASGDSLPIINWKYQLGNKAERLTVMSDEPFSSATLWVAKSDTLDFKNAKWESIEMEKSDTGRTAKIGFPESGYAAMFAEVGVGANEKYCSQSTQMCVLSSKGPVK